MTKHLIAVAAAVAVLGAAGCSKGSDATVIARINQSKITAGDYKRQLEGLENFQMEQAVATDPKARKEFLDDLIGIELVLQEAKRQGLDRDAEYKKTMDGIKKDYEDAKQRMEKRYRDASKNELFKALLKKELAEKAKTLEQPSAKEVRAFYDKNRDKLVGMDGKPYAFRDVEPQIKNRLMQDRQRDLYLEYIKSLQDKAKVTVDDKALDALASSLAGTVTLQVPQTSEGPAAK